MQENILGFKISMHDTLLNELNEPIAYLFQHLDSFFFWYSSSLLHYTSELASITKLLDDVVTMLTFHNIKKANNIIWLQRFEDLYFWE